MVTNYLLVLWLLMPAGAANLVPPLAAKLWPKFSYPMDFNLEFRKKRVLGSHKTFRGLIAGVICGEIIFLLQKYLITSVVFTPLYSGVPWYFGGVVGAGALGGDAVKSFFKRQFGVVSGKTWFPWDQIDWIIGTLIIAGLMVKFRWQEVLFVIFAGILLHLAIKAIGFLLKINETII